MKNLRTHGRSTIVWLLLGMLVLGLGGFGVTSFSGGTVTAGSVGREEITAEDYARALEAEARALAEQVGAPVPRAQLRALGVPQAVQARLFTGAALAEEARLLGLSVGDARIAQVIAEAPAFQGPGGAFDRAAYAETLRRGGLTEAEFEADIRTDEARLVLQRAIAGGIVAPEPVARASTAWMLQSRDLTWREVTASDLPAPVADPDAATLQAWHTANAPRFTAPEARRITYAAVTPDMLAESAPLDEAALRAAYDARADAYRQPERRLVERLVWPDAASAADARARLDAGAVDFEGLAAERGLTLADADLGTVTEAELGAAGPGVFALGGPGVVGPVDTEFGPALYQMNAILAPVDIRFEQALPELRAEAAADAARRQIDAMTDDLSDRLAGGATLEQLADETAMEVGTVTLDAETEPQPGSIAGYAAFREAAAAAAEGDFPELVALDDGGVVALRLDGIDPPALRPFETVRDAVAADWRAAETVRLLAALAETQRVEQPDLPATAAPGLTRDGWIDGVPPAVIAAGFALPEPGDSDVVEAEGRVFVVRLTAVNEADLTAAEPAALLGQTRARQSQALAEDVFAAYARALAATLPTTRDQAVIDAVESRLP